MAICNNKKCSLGECDQPETCAAYVPVLTRADKICSMNDQEPAVFLSGDLKEPCDYCQLAVFEGACTETLCDDAMMKWLQQPAEEVDHEDRIG